MLTEGLCRVGRICRGPGVADRRRVAAVLGEVAAEERSGLLGSTDRRAVRLRRGCEAQGGRSTKGTERFRRRLYSPAMEYGVIPVAAVAGAVRGGLGVVPGAKVRLLRGSGEDAVQRGGTATAVQGSGGSGSGGG